MTYNDYLVGGSFNEECASLGFLNHSMALKDYLFKKKSYFLQFLKEIVFFTKFVQFRKKICL